MAQVDQALRRAAYDIGYKDELIGVLEAEVTALREGRTEDADAAAPGPRGPAASGRRPSRRDARRDAGRCRPGPTAAGPAGDRRAGPRCPTGDAPAEPRGRGAASRRRRTGRRTATGRPEPAAGTGRADVASRRDAAGARDLVGDAAGPGAGEVTATVIVNAPAERVFAAFTAWERQGEWIPFTRCGWSRATAARAA